MKIVKVGVMPGKIVEVVAEDNVTVRDLLNLAKGEFPTDSLIHQVLSGTSGAQIKADSIEVDLDTVINASAVIVARPTKGN